MRSWIKGASLLFLALAVTPRLVSDDLVQKKGLTLAIAKQIVATAEKESCKKRCAGVIAVVDEGGNLLYFERVETNNVAEVDLALQKAHSSFVYRATTKSMQERLEKGEMRILKLPDMMPNTGGMPLMVDGKIVGAIGVAGMSDNDAVATAAVDEFKRLTQQQASTQQAK
jgi:glc operon protein GlcG